MSLASFSFLTLLFSLTFTCGRCHFSGTINSTVNNRLDDELPVATEDSQLYCTGELCERHNESSWTENVNLVEVDRSWWCPDGYYLMKFFRQCMQKSCLWTTTAAKDGLSLTCLPLSAHYKACQKIPLAPTQYEILDINASLWIPHSRSLVPLGDFVIIWHGIASVCQEDTSVAALAIDDIFEDMPLACMPFRVPADDFHVMSDGTAYAFNHSISLRHSYYDNNSSKNIVDVCYQVQNWLHECQKGKLFKEEFEVLPNMDVRINSSGIIVEPLGTYALNITGETIAYCIRESAEAMSAEKRYMYGIAFVVSAVFLFLSLLAHLLYPRLSYHAKALMCHIVSMFVMYVMLSIYYLITMGGWTDIVQCYSFFAVRYIASIGAFFWLNVLAFDLWHVFAKMKGTISSDSSSRKKRKFILQCLYSWGIASLLCFLTILADNMLQLQDDMNVSLNLSVECWFINKKSIMIFFFAPILVILVTNTIFFVLTIVNLKRASEGTQILKKSVSQKLLRVFVKLFVVMGMSWFAEVISALVGGEEHWSYATDMINALQGFAIFLVYTCKRTTLHLIQRKMGHQTESHSTMSSSSSLANRHRAISNNSLNTENIEIHSVTTQENVPKRNSSKQEEEEDCAC